MRYPPSVHFITARQFWQQIDRLYERINQMEASQQQQVDAIVAELATVQTDLASAQSTLQAEIDSLAAGNPVNLAALQTAVDQLDPVVKQLAGLKPTQNPVTRRAGSRCRRSLLSRSGPAPTPHHRSMPHDCVRRSGQPPRI